MNRKMSNPPVYYALAQVQFNPIAAMESYIKQIQDKLRLEGYTLFEEKKNAQLHFEASTSPPQARIIEIPMWCITKPDQTAGFIIGQSYLTYHTTHYTTHDQFFNELLLGLKTIHSIIKLEHLRRLGLRYLNAVLPLNGETIDQYLVSGLHGIRLDAQSRYSLIESVFDTHESLQAKGTLVSRIHSRTGQLGYPPDITPGNLSSMPRFITKDPTSHAVIDLDHFIEGQMPLDFEKIKDELNALHKHIKHAFNTSVTDHAKKIWNERLIIKH